MHEIYCDRVEPNKADAIPYDEFNLLRDLVNVFSLERKKTFRAVFITNTRVLSVADVSSRWNYILEVSHNFRVFNQRTAFKTRSFFVNERNVTRKFRTGAFNNFSLRNKIVNERRIEDNYCTLL